ncbi:M14 family zinc carboxypeptidase [Candidatus Latescibacterota bacterium]
MKAKNTIFVILIILIVSFSSALFAQGIMSPEEYLGFRVGDDYKLAHWDKIYEYFLYLSENSDRVNVREVGKSMEFGLPYIVAEITDNASPEELQRCMENQRKIHDPRLIANEEEEQRLINESKAVVLFGCSVHSNEVGGSQMSMELAYDLASGNSPKIREILENTVVVLIPSRSPDGLNKVAEWYEGTIGKPWEGSGMPWLYHTYAGHDNGWDTYMLSLTESQNDTKVLYKEWLPNIVVDVHQMGNTTCRMDIPPYIDPTNPTIPSLYTYMLLITGGAIGSELTQQGKTGIAHSSFYNNWTNGLFRSVAARHNMVGILTELASVNIASPVFIPKSRLQRGSPGEGETEGRAYVEPRREDFTFPRMNFPNPWPGGWWRLRDIVDYNKSMAIALSSFAAHNHAMFENYTLTVAREAIEKGKTEPPFAWLVPPEQRDSRTAAEMLQIFVDSGIEVHRAEQQFTADGQSYPAGTYIMFCSQPFRPHLNDLMMRQEPPEDPIPNREAGWTLPLQMGVNHVGVVEPFECSAKLIESIPIPKGSTTGKKNAGSYVVEAGSNDDYRFMNRLHKAGIPFSVVASAAEWEKRTGDTMPTGTLFIPNGGKVRTVLPKLLDGISTTVTGSDESSSSVRAAVTPAPSPRTALYQSWTACMPEGWTRLVLDNFEFPYTSIHDAEIREIGNLRDRYDCIILPSEQVPDIVNGNAPGTTEPQYVGGIGLDGVANLQYFVQEGGTLLCLDESTDFPIQYFNIPVRNIMEGKGPGEFYCRGSLLRVTVDQNNPVCYGLPEWMSVNFVESQAFEVIPPSDKSGESSPENQYPVKVAARYAETALLESGWIRGSELIAGKPAIVEVSYGKGRIILIGFRTQFRHQPHGTFRFLFNAIQSSTL